MLYRNTVCLPCTKEWQAARDLPKKAINSGGAEGHHKKRVQKDHHKKRVQKDRKKRARKGLPVSTAPSFPRAGSTATVLLIVGNKVFVANCGDSAGEETPRNAYCFESYWVVQAYVQYCGTVVLVL